MRFVLFLVFLVACALALGYGVLGLSDMSRVLSALWVLIAVVALVGRGVLDALQRVQRGAEPPPSSGYSGGGGVKMPSWLEGTGSPGQK